MCSQRLLYFAHNTVRWCCRKTRWSEESDAADCVSAYASAEQDQIRLLSPQLELHKLPVLSEYEALVNSFNTRGLTYPEDALFSFAGVATLLAEKFNGGLISGIPEMFFDICLLWRPLRITGNSCKRRIGRTPALGLLPSWSWAGWETEVNWPYTWNYDLDFSGPTPIMLGDIRPFNRIQPNYVTTDESKVPINATWFDEAIEMMKQKSLSEWRTDSIDDAVRQDWGLGHEHVVYKHETEPGIGFCFPLFASHICNSLSWRQAVSASEPHLVRFQLGEVRRSVTRIHIKDGTPAGTLWQHDDTDSDFLRATTGPIGERSSIELIAILGCTTPREHDFIWEMPDISVLTDLNSLGALPRTEDIYNVMWIARDEEGIAHRKGTGIVQRDIWEKEELDWIDVILG